MEDNKFRELTDDELLELIATTPIICSGKAREDLMEKAQNIIKERQEKEGSE